MVKTALSAVNGSLDRARSSAGERFLDMEGVTGSISVAPTNKIIALLWASRAPLFICRTLVTLGMPEWLVFASVEQIQRF